MNSLLRVLNSTPINRKAAIVASQRKCAIDDPDISKEEVVLLSDRLVRKMRLMKLILGVKSKKQHKNLVARYKAGAERYKGYTRRLVKEYIFVGQAIQILNKRMCQINSVRRSQSIPGLQNDAPIPPMEYDE